VLLLAVAAVTAVAPAQAAAPVGYAATVLAGGGTGDPVTSPSNATVVDGSLYWVSASRRAVWRQAADGTTSVLAGVPGASGQPTPGPATSSTFVQPNDVAVDGATTYVADGGGYLLAVRGGVLSVVAGNGNTAPVQGAAATASGLGSPYGLAVDTDHTVWLASTGALTHVRADGTLDVFSSPAVQELRDVAVGPDGTVWVADYRAGDVKRLDRSTGTLVRVPELSGAGGLSGFPTSIAVTTTGDVLTTFAFGSGLVRWRAGRVDVLALTTGTGTADAASFDVLTVSTGSGGLVDVVGGGSTPRIAAIAEGSAARCVPGTVDEADEGKPYSYRFGTTGWPTPTLAPATGAVLPAGLTLTGDGVLSGTPTTAGASTFDLTATNRYATDTCTVSFRVRAAAPPPPPPTATPTATATATAPPTATATTVPTPPGPVTPAPSSGPVPVPVPTEVPTGTPTGTPTVGPSATATPTVPVTVPTASPSTTASPTSPAPPPAPTPPATPPPTTVAETTPVTPRATAPREPLPPEPSPPQNRSAAPSVAAAVSASPSSSPAALPASTPAPTPSTRPATAGPVPESPGPAAGASVRRSAGPGDTVRAVVDVVLESTETVVRQVAVAVVAQRQISVGVLVVVAVFLLVQDRLDRNDPKLAAAPLVPLPDLPYEPPTNGEDHR
jgi:sugar lactone lactonase YvrE